MMKFTHFFPLLALGMTVAQGGQTPSAHMKPVDVALFKNGYGFVTLEGTLPEGCKAELSPLPVPTLGTFWLEAGKGARIARVVSGMENVEEPSGQISPALLAAANPGADVRVTLNDGRTVEGKLVSPPRPDQPGSNGNVIGGGKREPGEVAQFEGVLVKAAVSGYHVFVARQDILQFELLTDRPKLPTIRREQPVVTLELNAPAPGAPVRATCLATGVAWHPSYRIALGENGKALFEAKATVVNNLMDMDGVSLELITGFPSLQYAEEKDPMALFPKPYPRPLILAKGRAAQLNNMAASADFGAQEAAPAMAEPNAGVQSEDLFFYPLENFSAKVGEVVTLPLFATEMDYKHIYTWDVADPSSFARYRNNDNFRPEVWHCIRMKNTLTVPLTKAPVEFTARQRIAGQNTMPYTPVGGDFTVKMNRAVNVQADQSLRLIKREKYRTLRNRDTYKSENEVLLALDNRTGSEITIEVKQHLNGVITQTSDDAKTSIEVNFNNPENPSSMIEWTLHLKPGERKTVSYHYIYID